MPALLSACKTHACVTVGPNHDWHLPLSCSRPAYQDAHQSPTAFRELTSFAGREVGALVEIGPCLLQWQPSVASDQASDQYGSHTVLLCVTMTLSSGSLTQPFSPALWVALAATVFFMATIFYLFSHLSVRGAYPVRKPREGTKHLPGLPIAINMAARAPPADPFSLYFGTLV